MPKLTLYSLLILSLAGYVLIGYFIERSNFELLITTYSSLFLISYLILKNKRHYNLTDKELNAKLDLKYSEDYKEFVYRDKDKYRTYKYKYE